MSNYRDLARDEQIAALSEALTRGYRLMVSVETKAVNDPFYDGRQVEKWCSDTLPLIRSGTITKEDE